MHKCGILIKEFLRYEVILGLFEGVCTNLEYRGVDVHKSGNGSFRLEFKLEFNQFSHFP